VSDKVKAVYKTVEVSSRKTNKSESSFTHREVVTISSKSRAGFPLLGVYRRSGSWVNDGRCRGGVILGQAPLWNCGNQSFQCKGRIPSREPTRIRVPMWRTGADQLVVVLKHL